MSDERTPEEISDQRFVELMDWLEHGRRRGWIGPQVCTTHDGLPMTNEEEEEFEEGGDPCVFMLRIYYDEEMRLEIEANHSPSLWRKPPEWL